MTAPVFDRLICTTCATRLTVAADALACGTCQARFPIVDGIPRFVPQSNYADSFGFQWNTFSRTQLDEHWGINASRERFERETRWPSDLRGQVMVEAGCGAGRFTAHAARTGATLVSFDYSSAVEAAHRTHAALDNVTFLQADIYRVPLAKGSVDKVYCFGVLQHCPDPAGAFRSLAALLKPGGEIVVDVYRLDWKTIFTGKYYLRPFTKHVSPRRLLPLVERYVRIVYPALGIAHKLVGSRPARALGQVVSVCDYRGYFPLPDAQQFELSVLDTFDMLSPAHDHPQTIATIEGWCRRAGLEAIEVTPGYNGVEARGRRPLTVPRSESR